MEQNEGSALPEGGYETLCRHVPDAIVVVDESGCLLYVSPVVRARLGYDAESLVGERLLEYIHDEDADTLETWVPTGTESAGTDPTRVDDDPDVRLVEARVQTAEHGWTWMELATTGERVESLGGQVVSARDITDRRWYKRQAEQQNARLEAFTGVVSHDLQTPLSVASGSLELYRQTGDEAALERVERAHRRMRQLTSDLLALAREGSVVDDPQPVSLHDCVRQALGMSPLRSDQATIDDLPVIRADPSRLQSLFENLFRNVVEHGDPDTQVWVDALTDGFAVEDDGPGIPPDALEQVFEAGYSSDPQGTGFGLNIVETIAAAHGWEVTATIGDRAGGARFEISGVDVVGGGDGADDGNEDNGTDGENGSDGTAAHS